MSFEKHLRVIMNVDIGGIRETGSGPIQFTTETSVGLAEVKFLSE
jgi:hypothetical protein